MKISVNEIFKRAKEATEVSGELEPRIEKIYIYGSLARNFLHRKGKQFSSDSDIDLWIFYDTELKSDDPREMEHMMNVPFRTAMHMEALLPHWRIVCRTGSERELKKLDAYILVYQRKTSEGLVKKRRD